jgi:hypothetical protein
MIYIVTAGLDDWITGILKQYIFEVLSYQPHGIENLYAKSLYALETWSTLLWNSMLLLLFCTVETSSGMSFIENIMPATFYPLHFLNQDNHCTTYFLLDLPVTMLGCAHSSHPTFSKSCIAKSRERNVSCTARCLSKILLDAFS